MKILVGAKGTVATCMNDHTGEIRWEMPLTPGVYPMARFKPLCPTGHTVLFGKDASLVKDVGNSVSCKPRGQFESAANPHYRVSPAQRQIREMTRMMRRTEALAKRADKQMKAIQRAKSAVPLIESQPAPVAPSENAGEVSAT